MPVIISPESEYAKELAKWDTPRRNGGMGPDGFVAYPKMLYRAVKKDNGKIVCMDAAPSTIGWLKDADYERAVLQTDTFNKSCQRVVRDEAEERRAYDEGWRDHPHTAVAHVEALDRDIATAAAEANFAARRMSPQAQAERQAADDATHEHLADLPAPKTRGPRRRVAVKARVSIPTAAGAARQTPDPEPAA